MAIHHKHGHSWLYNLLFVNNASDQFFHNILLSWNSFAKKKFPLIYVSFLFFDNCSFLNSFLKTFAKKWWIWKPSIDHKTLESKGFVSNLMDFFLFFLSTISTLNTLFKNRMSNTWLQWPFGNIIKKKKKKTTNVLRV